MTINPALAELFDTQCVGGELHTFNFDATDKEKADAAALLTPDQFFDEFGHYPINSIVL